MMCWVLQYSLICSCFEYSSIISVLNRVSQVWYHHSILVFQRHHPFNPQFIVTVCVRDCALSYDSISFFSFVRYHSSFTSSICLLFRHKSSFLFPTFFSKRVFFVKNQNY